MDKDLLRQYYHRISRWQQAGPHYVNRHKDIVQHCHNCGTEFRDNFCPRCGQRAEVGRVGWNSIRDNVAILWGLDSRSLTYTLVQLFGRPGYMVREYISGHRQVSFPPIKMLVIVCLFVVVIESMFHLENDVLPLEFKIKEVDEVVRWMNAQKSWTTLLVQSICILPTWLVFRYAPGYPHHTLPEATKDVDCFYVYPTEYNDASEGASTFADINDTNMRTTAGRTYLVQGTAFEEVANVFAPYYRQVNMQALISLPTTERNAALSSIPKTDILAAIDYYFKNLNGGRPFILASHSQGSIMQSFVLAEYMKAHPEYLKRMIAAYVIGYSITKDYLKVNPHLKFAEGSDDTGVIISYNTEAAGNENNIVVLPDAISINPINWKRDDTYASAEENLGGYLFNYETKKLEIVPHAADAQIDLKRGVVITTTKVVEPVSGLTAFGTGSYHENDYDLYYNNIKANVAKRVAAYKAK